MKMSSGILTASMISACGTAGDKQNTAVSEKRPNILMILVDDLGYGDLSSYGAKDLQTPHIDSIVTGGMRFDSFYANCPVCSPTRASLLTGCYPERVGVPGVIRTHPENSWGYLSTDYPLLPALLGQAGYATAIVGKWHLGLTSPNTPNERGFDFFHGFLGDMMDDYYNHRRHGINYMRLNEKEIDPEGHATDLFSEWASDYLREQNADKPFFLYLAYNAPHTPIQPPDEWVDRVTQREQAIDPERAKLAALIEHMDHGIGQVLNTLQETGLDSNTLVIFSSDNGGLLRVGADNGPLRDGKGTLYEGGIRVPTAAKWPGRIDAGTQSDRVALTMDLMPTMLDAAGVQLEHDIDGRSFLPTLCGKQQREWKRDLFFIRREGGSFFEGKTIEAIRRGDWKLLRAKPEGPLELYNLEKDPKETKDLSSVEKSKFKELRKALLAHQERYEDVPWQPPERRKE